jgi:hypothetical protein
MIKKGLILKQTLTKSEHGNIAISSAILGAAILITFIGVSDNLTQILHSSTEARLAQNTKGYEEIFFQFDGDDPFCNMQQSFVVCPRNVNAE